MDAFILVIVSILLGLFVHFYVLPQRDRYRRMKVRAYEALVYAEYLANHFGVSKDTIQHINTSYNDPVLGDDYAKLEKALYLLASVCLANNIADPYAEPERLEEKEYSKHDDYPV